jgi:hypothetical protein
VLWLRVQVEGWRAVAGKEGGAMLTEIEVLEQEKTAVMSRLRRPNWECGMTKQRTGGETVGQTRMRAKVVVGGVLRWKRRGVRMKVRRGCRSRGSPEILMGEGQEIAIAHADGYQQGCWCSM